MTQEGLEGQGRITAILEGKTEPDNDIDPWVLYKFKVQMDGGKERTFSTFNDFGADLRTGQRIAFVYRTKPYTYTDRNTGATKEATGYNMDVLTNGNMPDPLPQNKREAGEQMQSGQQPQYEGWRIGQARNLAATYVGPKEAAEGSYPDFESWWKAIEDTAQKIAPRLTNEFTVQPSPDAPEAASSPVTEPEGTETPETSYSAASQEFIDWCRDQKYTAKQVTGWLGISADDWKTSRIDSWLIGHEGATAQDAMDRVLDRAQEQTNDDMPF